MFASTPGPAGLAVGATNLFWASGTVCPAESASR